MKEKAMMYIPVKVPGGYKWCCPVCGEQWTKYPAANAICKKCGQHICFLEEDIGKMLEKL